MGGNVIVAGGLGRVEPRLAVGERPLPGDGHAAPTGARDDAGCLVPRVAQRDDELAARGDAGGVLFDVRGDELEQQEDVDVLQVARRGPFLDVE